MTLRKDKLEKIRAEILGRRETLARELTAANAALIADDEAYSDAIDQASAESDKVLADHIRKHERVVMIEMDEALRRIEDGSFGDCASCGEEIAEARLLANPSTTLCIDCKAELESEQVRYPGR